MRRLISTFLMLALLSYSVANASDEKISITSIDDIKLNGILSMAEGKSLSDGVILMVHGTMGHGDMEIMRTLREGFNGEGRNALSITLSLSVDNRTGMYDCASEHRHNHFDAISEIGAWVTWLKDNGAGSITLLGHSRGGSQATSYIIENDDSSVDNLVLLAPLTSSKEDLIKGYIKKWRSSLKKQMSVAKNLIDNDTGDQLIESPGFLYCKNVKVSAESFYSYYRTDLVRDSAYFIPVIKKPFMLITGSRDKVVDNARLFEAIKKSSGEYEPIDEADHFFRDLFADEVVEAVDVFIEVAEKSK